MFAIGREHVQKGERVLVKDSEKGLDSGTVGREGETEKRRETIVIVDRRGGMKNRLGGLSGRRRRSNSERSAIATGVNLASLPKLKNRARRRSAQNGTTVACALTLEERLNRRQAWRQKSVMLGENT